MQLSPKMRERDLREFMSSVGLVRDVRVIADPRTKKCKGVAYVEFKAPESVALAIGLTGQKLLGIPIQVSEGVVVLVRDLQVLLPRYSDKSNQGRLGGGRTSNNIHRDLGECFKVPCKRQVKIGPKDQRKRTKSRFRD